MAHSPFWAEALSAGAQDRARTSLNSQMHDGGSVSEGLLIRSDEVGPIGGDAFTIHGILDTHVRGDDSETHLAAIHFRKDIFDTGRALHTLREMWPAQLATLEQSSGKISNHLNYSVESHRANEEWIALDMRNSGSEQPASPLARFAQDGPQ
ncbi:hypothetical protein PJ985_09595 [Streptomyces sp. ACA25]|uniref:hypothetical protein n=1 Tax=Streptomyces sp. ACA25 TaxID=3022596 RepID=UPI00230707CF|nr:hypothetical protein [Streptomyces sp. ACA25]MDB1087816.1 hypothetical protein [Streptomyces sp. ACA25]